MKMRTTKNRMYLWGVIFSICMIAASIMMLPTKTYAADDEVIAIIHPNEGGTFEITASPTYYKNDGSTGTESDYNFYYDGSKLYVKDADVYQISTQGETAERHLEFIGESTINSGFVTGNAKLYIEGTANSKINIGDYGLYVADNMDDAYVGINNANIIINSKGNDGISVQNIGIANSNVKINAENQDAGIECYTCTVNNSVLDISAGVGITGGNLKVTGGRLTTDCEYAGIYLVENILGYKGDVLTTFNGGTHHINGEETDIVSPAMTVTGGSILVNSMYQDVYQSSPLVPTKADGKTPLYLTQVSVSGVTKSTKITSLTTSESTYNTKDIYTDASGKIYLYLPAGATVTKAAIGTSNYTGKITATTEGASGTLNKVAILAAPKTFGVKLYGYHDVYASWNKVSGASGYRVYYKKSTSSAYSYKDVSASYGYVKLGKLSDGTKYNVKVSAYQTINGEKYWGSSTSVSSINTLKKLATPKVSKKSSKKVTVKWSNIAGESGYQISKATSKKKTSIVATVKTTTGKSKVISAKKKKTYYYKVRAYKTVGSKKIYGPWSNVKSYKLK